MNENELIEQTEPEFEGVDEYANTLPPIEIDIDTYNQELFFKGIDDASYESGYITGLLNTGMNTEEVLTYIINKQTIEYNLKSIELNNATQIEIAKNQKVLLEKEEL